MESSKIRKEVVVGAVEILAAPFLSKKEDDAGYESKKSKRNVERTK